MVKLHLFGAFQITVDGQPLVPIRSDKTRALLAYLALEGGRPLRRTRLAQFFWDGYSLESARTSLRVALANLRGLLQPSDLLFTNRHQVHFKNNHPSFWCDALLLDTLANRKPETLSAALFQELQALVQAEFLEGFDRLDSRPFQYWLSERRKVYAHLMTQVQARAAHLAPAGRPPARRPLLHNLPALPPRLFARAGESHDLCARLRAPATRLITVVGAAGAGKTTLVQAALYQLIEQPAPEQPDGFEPVDGVYWVLLAECHEPPYTPGTLEVWLPLARALGVAPAGALEEQVLASLGERRLCLVIENIAPVDAHKQVLRAILRAAPASRLVAIAGQPLCLSQEEIFALAGGMPLAAGLADWSNTDATRMFRACVPAGQPLGAEEQEAALRLCRLVQGLPLAVILAASQLDRISVTALAAQVEQHLRQPAGLYQPDDAHEQVLRAVLDAVWPLLTMQEQTLLQRLSIFCGSFRRQAALALGMSPQSLLDSLCSRRLLRIFDGERYILLPSLRRYFARQRRAHPAIDQVTQQRFCSVMGDWVVATIARARGSKLVDELGSEWVHLHLAWHCALDQHQFTALERLWPGLECVYDACDPGPESEKFCAAALARLPAGAPPLLFDSLQRARQRFGQRRLQPPATPMRGATVKVYGAAGAG